MRYRVTLSPFTVDAKSDADAQREAVQAVYESPDLFVVTEERDRAAELYAAERSGEPNSQATPEQQ